MTRNLAAYTALGHDAPPYISINVRDGHADQVEVTMRGPIEKGSVQVVMDIPAKEFKALVYDLIKNTV